MYFGKTTYILVKTTFYTICNFNKYLDNCLLVSIFTQIFVIMNYVINQSLGEVKYAYSRLLDKLDEHMKTLKDGQKPFISYVGMKRSLLRLKLDYLEQKPINGNKLRESEELLVNKIIQVFGIDVSEAASIGLLGEKEMKKVLILKRYEEMAKEGLKYKDIKTILSKEYGVSVSSIEKMVYRK